MAVGGDGFVEELRDLLGVGDVGLQRNCLAVCVANLIDYFLCGFAAARIVDDNCESIGGEPLCDSAADSA